MYKPLSFALFILIFEDLPMLDHMGSQHLCRNYSFSLRARIPGSVNISYSIFYLTLIYGLSYLADN